MAIIFRGSINFTHFSMNCFAKDVERVRKSEDGNVIEIKTNLADWAKHSSASALRKLSCLWHKFRVEETRNSTTYLWRDLLYW